MKTRMGKSFVILCATLLLAVGVVLAYGKMRPNSRAPINTITMGSGAKISANVDLGYQEGAEQYLYIEVDGASTILPLNTAGTVSIQKADGAQNVVTVKKGAFLMREASCGDQECVKAGQIPRTNGDHTISCASNGLVLRMLDAEEAKLYAQGA